MAPSRERVKKKGDKNARAPLGRPGNPSPTLLPSQMELVPGDVVAPGLQQEINWAVAEGIAAVEITLKVVGRVRDALQESPEHAQEARTAFVDAANAVRMDNVHQVVTSLEGAVATLRSLLDKAPESFRFSPAFPDPLTPTPLARLRRWT